jgi:hypothetical protein
MGNSTHSNDDQEWRPRPGPLIRQYRRGPTPLNPLGYLSLRPAEPGESESTFEILSSPPAGQIPAESAAHHSGSRWDRKHLDWIGVTLCHEDERRTDLAPKGASREVMQNIFRDIDASLGEGGSAREFLESLERYQSGRRRGLSTIIRPQAASDLLVNSTPERSPLAHNDAASNKRGQQAAFDSSPLSSPPRHREYRLDPSALDASPKAAIVAPRDGGVDLSTPEGSWSPLEPQSVDGALQHSPSQQSQGSGFAPHNALDEGNLTETDSSFIPSSSPPFEEAEPEEDRAERDVWELTGQFLKVLCKNIIPVHSSSTTNWEDPGILTIVWDGVKLTTEPDRMFWCEQSGRLLNIENKKRNHSMTEDQLLGQEVAHLIGQAWQDYHSTGRTSLAVHLLCWHGLECFFLNSEIPLDFLHTLGTASKRLSKPLVVEKSPTYDIGRSEERAFVAKRVVLILEELAPKKP